MPLEIRRLTPDDVSRLHASLTVFGEAFDEREIYTGNPPSEDYARRRLDDETLIELPLIERSRSIAAACGAHALFVQADTEVEDEPAIVLYSELGTREDVVHFDIALVGETLPLRETRLPPARPAVAARGARRVLPRGIDRFVIPEGEVPGLSDALRRFRRGCRKTVGPPPTIQTFAA